MTKKKLYPPPHYKGGRKQVAIYCTDETKAICDVLVKQLKLKSRSDLFHLLVVNKEKELEIVI